MSQPNLSQLIEISENSAFKNNNIYTGNFTLSGSAVAGTNVQTITVPLSVQTDMVSIIFNGPTDTVFSLDPRPSDGWFTQGSIWVIGNGGTVSNYPTPWQMYGSINGTNLIITAVYVQTFIDTVTLTNTIGYYRVIDYSVF